jgi:hypothetical protein
MLLLYSFFNSFLRMNIATEEKIAVPNAGSKGGRGDSGEKDSKEGDL